MSDSCCDSGSKNNCCDGRIGALEKKTARLCCWLTCLIVVLLCAASFALGVCCGKRCGAGGGGCFLTGGSNGPCGVFIGGPDCGPGGDCGFGGPRGGSGGASCCPPTPPTPPTPDCGGGDVDVQVMRWNAASGPVDVAGLNLGNATVRSKVMIVGPDGKAMNFDGALTPEMHAKIRAAMDQAMAGGGGAVDVDVNVQLDEDVQDGGQVGDSDDDA